MAMKGIEITRDGTAVVVSSHERRGRFAEIVREGFDGGTRFVVFPMSEGERGRSCRHYDDSDRPDRTRATLRQAVRLAVWYARD